MLKGWSREEVSVPNSSATGKKKGHKIEVLWFNYPREEAALGPGDGEALAPAPAASGPPG